MEAVEERDFSLTEYVNDLAYQLLLPRLLHRVLHIVLLISTLLLLLLGLELLPDLSDLPLELLPDLPSSPLLIYLSFEVRDHRDQSTLEVVELDQIQTCVHWLLLLHLVA